MKGLLNSLRARGAFQADGNSLERSAYLLERLSETLDDLARAADTAELLLKREYPGEAASLRQKVTAAKDLGNILRCETCGGHGWIDDSSGGHHCADCTTVTSTKRAPCQCCSTFAELTCGPSRFGPETWACTECWGNEPTAPSSSERQPFKECEYPHCSCPRYGRCGNMGAAAKRPPIENTEDGAS